MTNYLQGLTDLKYIIAKNNDSSLLGAEKPAIVIEPKKENKQALEDIVYRSTASINVVTISEKPEDIKHQLKEAIKKLDDSISNNRPLAERVKNWDTVGFLYRKLYKLNNNNKYDAEAKSWLRDTFKIITAKNNMNIDNINKSIPALIALLKKLPKIEAIYCLNTYLQGYFTLNSEKYLQDYISPEDFHNNKEGDCSEVALYTEKILKTLKIDCEVKDVVFDKLYFVNTSVCAHALTTFKFEENGVSYTGLIDNAKVDLFPSNKTFAMVLHDINPHFNMYRNIDPQLWLNIKKTTKDKTAFIDSNYTMILVTNHEKARIIEKFMPLSELFDIHPDKDLLFFKDNAEQILRSKLAGSNLNDTEKKEIFALYNKSVNLLPYESKYEYIEFLYKKY